MLAALFACAATETVAKSGRVKTTAVGAVAAAMSVIKGGSMGGRLKSGGGQAPSPVRENGPASFSFWCATGATGEGACPPLERWQRAP